MPADLTVGQFVYVIRKRIKVSPEKAIFMFVKNVLPPTGMALTDLFLHQYEHYLYRIIIRCKSDCPNEFDGLSTSKPAPGADARV